MRIEIDLYGRLIIRDTTSKNLYEKSILTNKEIVECYLCGFNIRKYFSNIVVRMCSDCQVLYCKTCGKKALKKGICLICGKPTLKIKRPSKNPFHGKLKIETGSQSQQMAEGLPNLQHKTELDPSSLSDKKSGKIIFISYATNDAEVYKIPEIAKGLAKFKEIQKVLYWQKDMREDITKYMNDNLGICDLIILFCSPNALESKPVEKEWMAASAMDKKIIPVFFDKNHIPPLLSSHLGLNCDPFNTEKNIKNILDLIKKRLD